MLKATLSLLLALAVGSHAATAQAPAPAPRADVAALPAALDALTNAMESAVIAKDAEAFMRCIDTAEPEFAVEQRNWAADLKEHGPQSFAITIDTAQLRESDGRTIAPMTMTWRLLDADKERSVTFDAVFTRRGDGFRYAGEEWQRLERDGLVVCFEEGLESAAEGAAEAFEKIRARVEKGFALEDAPQATKRQVIKLYRSMAHLQQSIYLSYVLPLGGWNEPEESIKILAGRKSNAASFVGLLAHEYGHVCTFALGDKANNMPWWVLEGVADLSTEPFNPGARAHLDKTVRAWARNDQLQPWETLADFRSVPGDKHTYVYAQGHHFLGYISDRFGRADRIAWLAAMAKGQSIDEASRSALGEPFNTLSADWRASLLAGRQDPGAD
jgi:hypothetical protein